MQAHFINYSFAAFINKIIPFNLLKLVRQTILKEPLLEIKQNGFMLGLILMMVLKVERELGEEEVRRMTVLSMVGIDGMRSAMRLVLRKKLILKCKLVKELEGKREKLVWSRREAKAKENGQKWKERVEKRLEKAKVRR